SLKTSIKTITYLSDTGCLEIQGASLGSTCKLLFHLRVNRNAGNHFICISVCQLAFHLFFRRYFVVIGDTSLKKAPVVVSQPCGV
ncbi:hypothetical protein, partial [Escherichia coli]|uniref:hypothetical protein n=2 Tax=Escherichia coli TaxID=562 RepID=UPI001BC88EFA